MKKTILIKLIICLSCCKLYSQEVHLADFEERSVSNLKSASRTADLAYSRLTNWKVFLEGENLKISRQTWDEPKSEAIPFKIDSSCVMTFKGRIVSKKVFNGWIISSACQEFGILRWYSEDGTETYIINNSPFLKLENYRDKILAFSISSHMGFNRGGLLELYFNKKESKWSLRSIYSSSKNYPIAITYDKKGNDYLVTSSGVIKILKKGEIKPLIEDVYGSPLSTPNSIALHRRNIYLGMAGGIIRITEKKNRTDIVWLENKAVKE